MKAGVYSNRAHRTQRGGTHAIFLIRKFHDVKIISPSDEMIRRMNLLTDT